MSSSQSTTATPNEYKHMFQPDLIFDIGMHNGTDAGYYLKKGFRVIGVEASPDLTSLARSRLADGVASSRLIIENVGISNAEGILTFYQNLDCNEWSSFHRHLGTRNNSRYLEIEVGCKRLDYFIGKYGMPYYLKIDVEGYDAIVARELMRWTIRPAYVSVEDDGIDALVALYETGVRKFKFINQVAIREYAVPTPAAEGLSIDHRFGFSSSGPFGGDLPGEWLDAHAAFNYYCQSVRPPGSHPLGGGWWDIHGCYDTAK